MHRLVIDEAPLTFTEALTPYLPLIGTIIGGIIIGLFALWNRKRGAVETRAPDVNEIWLQQMTESKVLDSERKLRRWLEDKLYNLLKIFREYVDRVHAGGDINLTAREAEAYGTVLPEELTLQVEREGINGNQSR